MTWFAVYETDSGRLMSLSTVVDESTLPANLSFKEVGEQAPDGVWNTTTKEFDPQPPVKPMVARIDFVRRFTLQEEVAIREAAKTDPMVNIFLSRLNLIGEVDTEHPDTAQGVGYLEMVGLLGEGRAQEILNG